MPTMWFGKPEPKTWVFASFSIALTLSISHHARRDRVDPDLVGRVFRSHRARDRRDQLAGADARRIARIRRRRRNSYCGWRGFRRRLACLRVDLRDNDLGALLWKALRGGTADAAACDECDLAGRAVGSMIFSARPNRQALAQLRRGLKIVGVLDKRVAVGHARDVVGDAAGANALAGAGEVLRPFRR
jgi:hypothetical protein